jgi:hypothetical protein
MKTVQRVGGGERRGAPNWLSHLNWFFSHEFHCRVLDLHLHVYVPLFDRHSYSLTHSSLNEILQIFCEHIDIHTQFHSCYYG